ncbi:MAG: hypothetical protein AB1716_15525 [Planctomycetota bacterium]
MHAVWRTAVYVWTLPTTAVGLALVPLALVTRGRARLVAGVLEVHGGAASWFLRRCTPRAGGAQAMTLGHVVLGTSAAALDATRRHERVHVRQAECWGPLFIPAYLLASLWALLRGRDLYRGNWFERAAFDRS